MDNLVLQLLVFLSRLEYFLVFQKAVLGTLLFSTFINEVCNEITLEISSLQSQIYSIRNGAMQIHGTQHQ
jgi:hypothetical protein